MNLYLFLDAYLEPGIRILLIRYKKIYKKNACKLLIFSLQFFELTKLLKSISQIIAKSL